MTAPALANTPKIATQDPINPPQQAKTAKRKTQNDKSRSDTALKKATFINKIKSILFKFDTTLLMLPAIGFGLGAIIFSRIEHHKKPLPRLIGSIFRKTLGFTFELFSLPARVYIFAKCTFAQTLNIATFNKFKLLKKISTNSIRQQVRSDIGTAHANVIIGGAFRYTYKDAFKSYCYTVKEFTSNVKIP